MEVEAEDAIVVASEGEESNGRWQRRLRKPSTKAKQNGEAQSSLDMVLPPSRKRLRGVSRNATTPDTQNDEMGRDGGRTMLQTLQEQMNEQTGILKIILEAWTKQEAHNKAMKAELVKDELQAVKDELNRTKQEMVEGMAALTSGQSSPSPSYADVAAHVCVQNLHLVDNRPPDK
ncbi:hypothetical protein V499_01884 [Pseudogymnoascus sp. VKM F-103]|nr:hypothetical protein V499_01884 [Pseudogymnoascus sp. VKM F-103]